MFVLKNEGDTQSLQRSDLLKVTAIQNQWLSILEQTKHQPHSSGPKSFSQLYQVLGPSPGQLDLMPRPKDSPASGCLGESYQAPGVYTTKSRTFQGRGASLKKENGQLTKQKSRRPWSCCRQTQIPKAPGFRHHRQLHTSMGRCGPQGPGSATSRPLAATLIQARGSPGFSPPTSSEGVQPK